MSKLIKCNNNFFSIPNKLNSYWAGFIAADGCITGKNNNNKNVLAITLSKKDENHLLNFIKDIEYEGKFYHYKKYNRVEFKTTSNKITNDLNNIWNITPVKSLTLIPPNINNSLFKDYFIMGYIDGDGCIGKVLRRNKYIYFTIQIIGTKQILEWIKNRFSEIIQFNIKNNIYKIGNVFKFSLEGEKVNKIINYFKQLGLPKLERKWNLV